jgi:hypothetical protein
MRKVVVYLLLSVDGVAESPEAFVHEFDQATFANLSEVISSQDAVLLGRRMYDEWAGFWPVSTFEPFAGFINNVQKYVVTSTQLALPWDNTTIVPGPVAGFVRELKEQPDPTSACTGASRWLNPFSTTAWWTSYGSSSPRRSQEPAARPSTDLRLESSSCYAAPARRPGPCSWTTEYAPTPDHPWVQDSTQEGTRCVAALDLLADGPRRRDVKASRLSSPPTGS